MSSVCPQVSVNEQALIDDNWQLWWFRMPFVVIVPSIRKSKLINLQEDNWMTYIASRGGQYLKALHSKYVQW